MKEKFRSALAYYRDLRPNNLSTPKYRHLWLLLYWPVYGLIFLTLERLMPIFVPTITYFDVSCALDAYIPFCEFFIVPYYYWFAFLVGMGAYGLFFDIPAFRNFMWFIIFSYTSTVIIYFAWPTMQTLRPDTFARDNLFVDIAKFLYDFDTNTNVCPSIHVLGSVAVCCAGMHSRTLRGWGWKTFFIVSTVLISISTVFLKQHSVIDVVAALAVCAVCWPLTVCAVPAVRRKIDARRAAKQADGN